MSEAISRKNRRILLWIYGAALLYFILKQLYFAVFVGGTPDQRAHSAYIVEMVKNPSLLPDFAHMPMYYIDFRGLKQYLWITPGDINYLGHPPLYYLLAAATGPVEFLPDGMIVIDYMRVIFFSIFLTSLGLVISFRLGYRHLKTGSPWVHALYACAIAALPEIAYVGGSANNDNLAFLGFAVFFTGVVRYHEDRLDLKTYLLIGIGFLLGSFSKLTTALIMLIMLVVILVMSIIRTRSLKLITNRYFLITLPCYLLFLVYEILIYRKYGGWQPGLALIAPEYYKTTVFYVNPEDRVPMTLFEYFRRFASGIGHSWSSLYGHNAYVNSLMNNGAAGVVYWIPAGVSAVTAAVQAVRRKADRYTIPAVLAFLGTLTYHFYTGWTGFLKNGYSGGIQARYYLPLIIAFAFIMCRTLPPLFRTEKAKTAGRILAVLLILCWLAGDAPRLVIHYGFPPV